MKKTATVLLVILFHSAAFAQLPSYLPVSGLVAWFPFTGNAIDSTGHGHNGTVSGASMTTDRYGNPNSAYYFNGTSDYIYVPPGIPGDAESTDITASLTISAWVKSQNYLFSGQEQIYWRGDPTPAHDPHMLYFNGSQIRVRRDIDPGTTSNEVGTSVTSLDTNFHLLTGTYDSASGVMAIYIDGVLENSAVLPGLETYPTSTMYNYIGAVDGGTWQFFYGTIDELGIWKRALTPCEVAALYYSMPSIITLQPVNDTVAIAGTAVFTVNDVFTSSTYQWQQNSGSGYVNLTNTPPYSGVYTPTLTITPVTYALSGNLYRCVPISGTCLTDTSAGARLVIPAPSVTYSIQSDKPITIVPNPNNGSFQVTGSFDNNNEVSMQITDLMGRVIYSGTATPQNGIINAHIELNNTLCHGVYFLKMHTQNENKTLPVLIDN